MPRTDAGYERLLVGSARWMIDARQERALHKSYILDVLDVFDVVPVPAQEFSTTFESLLRAAHLRHEEDGGPDGLGGRAPHGVARPRRHCGAGPLRVQRA